MRECVCFNCNGTPFTVEISVAVSNKICVFCMGHQLSMPVVEPAVSLFAPPVLTSKSEVVVIFVLPPTSMFVFLLDSICTLPEVSLSPI